MYVIKRKRLKMDREETVLDGEVVWRRIKRMKLSVEHRYVCVRMDTGLLLWQCKIEGFDLTGFGLEAVLKAALINMPSEM